jgi:hypothetical protein
MYYDGWGGSRCLDLSMGMNVCIFIVIIRLQFESHLLLLGENFCGYVGCSK